MKKTILTFFIFALSFSMFIENSYGQAKIEFRQIYRDEFVGELKKRVKQRYNNARS